VSESVVTLIQSEESTEKNELFICELDFVALHSMFTTLYRFFSNDEFDKT